MKISFFIRGIIYIYENGQILDVLFDFFYKGNNPCKATHLSRYKKGLLGSFPVNPPTPEEANDF